MRIMYVHANNGSDVRVQKSLNTLLQISKDIHFVGWLKTQETQEEILVEGVKYHFLKKYTGFGGIKVLKGLPLFWRFINKKIKELRPDKVIIANEENALWESIVRSDSIQYICDVHDSISDRMMLPKYFERLTLALRNLVYNRFDSIIFTDEIRRKKAGNLDESYVIYNAPFYVHVDIKNEEKFKNAVYFSGSISKNRGLNTIMKASELLGDVKIVIAGNIKDKGVKWEIENNRNIEYLGKVSFYESLKVAKKCMAIYSYYDPGVKNNVYASPNKLYESILLNVPILINSETIVSEFVKEKNLGLIGPYQDYKCLANNIRKIQNNNYLMTDLTDEFKAYYSWDNALKVYEKIFDLRWSSQKDVI